MEKNLSRIVERVKRKRNLATTLLWIEAFGAGFIFGGAAATIGIYLLTAAP